MGKAESCRSSSESNERPAVVLTLRRITVVIALLICLAWFALANPFNVGIRKSEHFSAATFDAIQKGEHIDVVINRLGKPLTVTKDTTFPTFCATGDGCSTYAFTAFPSRWAISYKEA